MRERKKESEGGEKVKINESKSVVKGKFLPLSFISFLSLFNNSLTHSLPQILSFSLKVLGEREERESERERKKEKMTIVLIGFRTVVISSQFVL